MDIDSRINALIDGENAPDATSRKIATDHLIALAVLMQPGRIYKGGSLDTKRTACLSDEEIAVFIDRKHDAPDYDRAAAHMSECDSCRRRAFSASELLDSPEVNAPNGLKDLAFEKARNVAGRKTGIRRFGILFAAAAVLVIAGLWALKQAVWETSSLPGTLGIKTNASTVDALAAGDAELLRRLMPDTGGEIKSLASMGDEEIARNIKTRASSEMDYAKRRYASAGYCHFLLKNGNAPAPEIVRQASLDWAAAGLDPARTRSLIGGGRHDDLYAHLASVPSRLKLSFLGGYTLGEIVYADRTGTVRKHMLDETSSRLKILPLVSLNEYLESIGNPDESARARLRERVRCELFRL